MSNDISLRENFIVKQAQPILLGSMTKHPETLEEYMRRLAREKGLTHKNIAERARARGYKLSAPYVGNLITGSAANPTMGIIRALAAGFDEPEENFVAVLKGKMPEHRGFRQSFFYGLWEDYQELSPKDQEYFKKTLEMLHQHMRRQLERLNND